MQKKLLTACCALWLVLVCLLSCEVEEPERYVRAPIIKTFSPTAQTLDALVGDTLRFALRAIDPGSRDVRYYFTLDDSTVARSTPWSYVVEDTGAVAVGGHASNGNLETGIVWRINRALPINLPPVIENARPRDPNPTTIIDTPVEFVIMASDPEGLPVSYVYTVDDSAVAGVRRYTYEPDQVGVRKVKAIVTDGETFTTHSWNLNVLPEPDSIPPAPVTIVSLVKGALAGELIVDWIAVGDDDMEGLPSGYLVRTSSDPIVDELSWSRASERRGEPDPTAPGMRQTMVIRDLKPANLVYVAVRAVDDFGNLSGIANTVGTLTKGMEVRGVVRNAVTNQPASGVMVRLAGLEDVTAADGSYALTELPAVSDSWRVRDEDGAGFGNYFDIVTPEYEIVDGDVVDFWVLPNLTLESTEYNSFLDLFKVMTDASSAGRPNLLRVWSPPVDLYVRPATHGGVDYEQTVKDIVLEWQAAIGHTVFRFVDAEPDTGVDVTYTSGTTRDHYQFIDLDPDGMPIKGRIVFRTVWDTGNVDAFKVVVRHELGHALGLYHSGDIRHIMVGGPAPVVDLPSQDEIWVATAIYNMPRGVDLDWYRSD